MTDSMRKVALVRDKRKKGQSDKVCVIIIGPKC